MQIYINQNIARIGLSDYESRAISTDLSLRENVENKVFKILSGLHSNIEVYNIPSGKAMMRIKNGSNEIKWQEGIFEWCLSNLPEKSQYGPYRDVVEFWE